VRQKKEQFRSIAVFPCKLRIMKEHIYMSRSVFFISSVFPCKYYQNRQCCGSRSVFRNPDPYPDPERQKLHTKKGNMKICRVCFGVAEGMEFGSLSRSSKKNMS
jgi:hypothetical protein